MIALFLEILFLCHTHATLSQNSGGNYPDANEAQRRRRQDPAVRAAEAEAKRRRRQDPEVRDAEAEAHRRRREQPEVSAAEAQSKRRHREDTEVRDAEAEAHRRRREQPEVSAAEAESKRRRRDHPEVRDAEAEAHRRRREQPGVSATEAEARSRYREDPEVRDAEAEAHRRRREHPEVSAAEAESKRRRREDPEVREAEAEAHRRRRPGVSAATAEAKQKARIAKPDGATKNFQRLFRDNPFGSVCSVCDRLWFQNDLQPLPDRCHETLEQSFPNSDLTQFKLCSTCIQSVHKGHIPHLSSSNGYVYPPKPAHLPQLNAVSERLISPRIPFMQLRRLMHGARQHGIKGPVVNVCVDVDDMVTMLPRAIEQDRALNVHLKRRMLAKTTYLAGAVKKCDLLPWLKLLCDSTLYKHYNIKCDFARLGDIVEVDEHDEIELLP
ncbi:uncharacterized protein LOC121835251 [Ixodes scapularis]|uniref:uncharacterized protein LOC121835251 n=1 Tax=Ixodes scapularis TaxID=6945 RepID=UPI001C39440C|nr:uncharacterized protein LOC121835251 [Ixodes scapularis]